MSNFRFTRVDPFPPIIKNLIIINILVYVAQLTMDNQYQITDKIMLWPVQFPQFKPYQIATNIFAHSGIGHIFFNMFSLWMFGRVLENVWGSKRFLFFYLACGVGATALHILMQYIRVEQAQAAIESGNEAEFIRLIQHIGPALGASGAVMGVMIGFAYLFPNTEFVGMILPIPIKAKWLALMWVAADLFGGFAALPNDNVGHFAHLGGALTGFIIVLIWNKTNRKTLY